MEMDQLARLNGIIARIYACAGEPRQWAAVLGEIRQLFNGSSVLLFTPFRSAELGGFWLFDEADPGLMKPYVEHFAERDIWWQAAVTKGQTNEGVVVVGDELVPRLDFLASEFYNDFTRPNNIGRNLSSILLDGSGDANVPRTHFSVYRAPRSRAFTDTELVMARLLVPHLQRALCLTFQYGDLHAGLSVAEIVYRDLPWGVGLVTADAGIRYANPALESILSANDGLASREGRLTARRPSEAARLEAILAARDLPGVSGRTVRAMRIRRHSGRVDYILEFTPLPRDANLPGLGGPVAMLVKVTDPTAGQSVPTSLLRELYRLTEAECRLVKGLLEGLTLKEAAMRFEVSENTVRSQLRAVFRKTGVRRQEELIRLAQGLGAG
jgi:DNA-binding CsgD family transcriptional regulator